MTTKIHNESRQDGLRTAHGSSAQISLEEFNAFRELIHKTIGISLTATKQALVCSRLSKRLRDLQMASFAEYYEFVVGEGPGSDEFQSMVNCITTNKTNFFREPHHFDFLRNKFFPRLKERAAGGHPRRLRIWSAGCSTGEEPYTIAMSILECFGPQVTQWDVRILASDIDTDVLAKAQAGQYSSDQLQDVSEGRRQMHFLQNAAGDCQVRGELKRLITFRQVNLIETPWPIHTHFDLIFCRNVLIYFDRPTQNTIVNRMAGMLADGGTLFLGHSENADWTGSDLVSLGNTIYTRGGPHGRRATDRAEITAGSPQDDPLSVANASRGERLQNLSARLQPARERVNSPRSGVKNVTRTAGVPAAASCRVKSGEHQASAEPRQLEASVGFGLVVCLFDPKGGVGGMQNLLTPHAPVQTGAGGDRSPQAIFQGERSLTTLLAELVRLGANPQRLQAKLFGGGQLPQHPELFSIGTQNLQCVRQFLADHKIPVVAERVSSPTPVEVHFQTNTGKALLRMLDEGDPLADQEIRLLKSLA